MTDLSVHGRQISNFFELLGDDENALTFALGWTLRQSPDFLKALLVRIFGDSVDGSQAVIRLQGYQSEHGYTDIEIDVSSAACAIIEAKRGWNLPGREQLGKYASRAAFRSAREKYLVVLTECLPEYIEHNLEIAARLRPLVKPLRWHWVIATAEKLAGRVGNVQKGVLREMATFLRDHTTARDAWSNLVYVLSLAKGSIEDFTITWIDVVEKKKKYFHPVGPPGWPSNPPTYLGFRYDGKLQSIHFVESYKVVGSLEDDIPEIKWGKLDRPHFLYDLGKPIRPSQECKTGNIFRAGRVWCALDLLLTSKTISEARDFTRKRHEKTD